jgi:superfamily II RNA helicase
MSKLPTSTPAPRVYPIIEQFKARYDFPLDTFQIEAAQELLEGRSVLVTAPTGSGKTIVAEFAIFEALDRKLQVIYTTPLKALSNQKYRDLLEHYPEDQVGLVTGDVSVNPGASVVVMTTEILRNILYQNPHRLDSVLYIVVDECHYMNDMDRGTVWEEIIIHAPSHICLVALSATIANAHELAAWISSIHNPMRVIEHRERSVPLNHFYYHEQRLVPVFDDQGEMHPKLQRIATKLKQQKKQAQQQARLQGGKRGGKRPKPDKPAEAQVVEVLQAENMLPAIYFIFSRKNCDDALEHCLDSGMSLTTPEERKLIEAEIKALVQEHPSLKETGPSTENLLLALPMGISAHHAGLVPMLRHLVEILFQKNLVKVVFATETLAAGINMPARTTVISSLSKRTDGGHRTLTVNEFTQMTGRAGRRGKDPVGYCVILGGMYQSPYQTADLIEGDYDPIASHFSLSYNMVLNLFRKLERPEIRGVLQKSFGQYLTNKEVINMSLQMEQKKQALEQIAPSAETKSYIRHLRGQIRTIQKQINRQREIYLQEFDAISRVLQYFRRIKPQGKAWELTALGDTTSHIRAQNDLLISLVLESIDFDELSPVEIAAVFSTLVFEPRRNMNHDLSPCSNQLRKVFKEILYVADDLRYVQEEENIHLPITVEFDFAPLVILWGNGCKWSTLFKFTEMADGDVVRAMRQLLDLLRQLETLPYAPDTFKARIKEAIAAIDRDLIQIIL